MKPINVNEFEIAAKLKLDQSVYDFIASGACDEYTLGRNLAALKKIHITPRVLRGTGVIQTTTKLLEHQLPQPLFVAPLAYHSLAHPLGEIATIVAMNDLGIGFTLSTMSSIVLEDVAASATCPLWFQLYIYKDRAITLSLIKRAELAGFEALVLTVDVPVMGKRERDIRNQFQLPIGVSAKNFSDKPFISPGEINAGSSVKNYTDAMFDPHLSWNDIKWLQSQTSLPLILKGIMHEEDAKIALEHNIAAIIISNHGGRQLDSMPATIEVLPRIAQVIDRKIPILIDGGIRRGTDIFKAIALGADCIMIGRPVMWALANAGAEGVKDLFTIYARELEETMMLCGCRTIEDIKNEGSAMVNLKAIQRGNYEPY